MKYDRCEYIINMKLNVGNHGSIQNVAIEHFTKSFWVLIIMKIDITDWWNMMGGLGLLESIYNFMVIMY